MELLRHLFFASNVLFLIVGSCLVGVGTYLLKERSPLEDSLIPVELFRKSIGVPTTIRSFSLDLGPPVRKGMEMKAPETTLVPLGVISVTFGTLIFAVSFTGCCGAVKNSICLLATFAIILGAIVMLEMIAVAVFMTYKPVIEAKAKGQLSELLQETYNASSDVARSCQGETNAVHDPRAPWEVDERSKGAQILEKQINNYETLAYTEAIDATMKHFKCCGVDSYQDFTSKQLSKCQRVPPACCKYTINDTEVLNDQNCPEYPSEENSWIRYGCFDRIMGHVINYVLTVGLAVILMQFYGVVFCGWCAVLTYKNRK